MNKETLYKFFEGNASFEEEVAVKQWMEESTENRQSFLKERKLFDAMLLLGNEKVIKAGKKRYSINLSSLRTYILFNFKLSAHGFSIIEKKTEIDCDSATLRKFH